MTERKIVLYLEQETFFEYKKISFPLGENFWQEWVSSPNLTRVVTYEIYNSFNPVLDHLFHNKEWNRSILINLRKNTVDKIALVSWNISQKHLHCRTVEEIYMQEHESFFQKTIGDVFLNKNISVMFDIKAQEYYEVQKKSPRLLRSMTNTFNKDIGFFISNNIFRHAKHRYRIYLDNRLLIERYYPVDIEYNRMLAETVYLNENAKGEIRVESDFNLMIKRVELDGCKHDIYSSIFALPNPDK
jgi:hypothetical protein